MYPKRSNDFKHSCTIGVIGRIFYPLTPNQLYQTKLVNMGLGNTAGSDVVLVIQLHLYL